MKRLLLAPLLLALSGCTSEIVVKNSVGEKYIVKKTTINVSETFRVKDLVESPASWDPLIKQVQGYVKDWERKFANCLESSKWGPNFCYEVQEYPITISYYQGILSEYKSNKKDEEDNVNYLKKMRLPTEYKNFNPKRIIYVKLKYTPIFENTNQIKSVQNEAEVKCWNPRINYRLGTTKLSSLESKICKKYAKF
tara:strand:+ start:98 stop:682 length:585 start_codon:yes stop_codon:yes gene_type:complete